MLRSFNEREGEVSESLKLSRSVIQAKTVVSFRSADQALKQVAPTSILICLLQKATA